MEPKKIIYNVVELPIKKYFCQVWIQLVPSFLRKRLKYEKNNRQTTYTNDGNTLHMTIWDW
jgi:hypothetical protein